MALEEAIEGTTEEPRPEPLCLHCLQPYDPLEHYCPKCGAAVGQFTPNIPFVNIRYQCEFWGGLWKQLWSPRQGHVLVRVVDMILIALMAPIMLLGIPFIVSGRQGRGRGESPINPVPPPLPTDSPQPRPPPLPPDSQEEP